MQERTFEDVRQLALVRARNQLIELLKERNCWVSEREIRSLFSWSHETVTELAQQLQDNPVFLVGKVMGEWLFMKRSLQC